MFHQQWKEDNKKQIIAKMAGRMSGKRNETKIKINDRNHQNSNGGHISTHQGKTSRGGCGGLGRIRDVRGGRGKNSENLKMWNVSIVAKKATILLTAHSQEKNDNEQSNMVSKSDFKNLFQSSLKEMLTKKDKKAKKKETN
jgi:hypothetical protein